LRAHNATFSVLAAIMLKFHKHSNDLSSKERITIITKAIKLTITSLNRLANDIISSDLDTKKNKPLSVEYFECPHVQFSTSVINAVSSNQLLIQFSKRYVDKFHIK
jgi:hypothetical protein